MTGLMPSCWGPSGWHFIHSIAYAYNPSIENKIKYLTFFENLGYVLPCDECKIHYRQNFNLEKIQKSLDSQEQLFRWTYDLHNLVNSQTGVPESKWPTYESVKKRFSVYESACDSTPGVCGSSSSSSNQRGTTVVEKTGSLNDDNLPFLIPMVIFVILLVISLYFNFRNMINVKGKKY
jgi:hypothetical protein